MSVGGASYVVRRVARMTMVVVVATEPPLPLFGVFKMLTGLTIDGHFMHTGGNSDSCK